MESILNVDDYGPGRYARTKILQKAGFIVREASTGREALQLIAEHNPTIVLLDVNLPDMSGFDVCKQVKLDPKTFATTVLHISATNIQVHHQVEGLDCGADSYLVEPVDPAVLIATVKAFLRARKAEEALRRSNEELERFGYRVAHDLSEPLRTMVAHTQLLERELRPHLSKESSKSLHFVIDAAARMNLFIEGLLSYAQVTYSARNIKILDCQSMIAGITANLDATISAHGARITHDPLPQVAGDPSLEQVFQNLISNAIKYGREGVPPQIHISAHLDGGEWVFSVRDNGVGIEADLKDSVFEVFRRLHGREIPGNGIGLAISKRIIESHSGTIWVESEPGVGSTFYFRLPKGPAGPSLPSRSTNNI
jgi:two-component system, sensor histidine kinase and response regulator